ncbi:MAG: putative metal-binding motif-containing protein [Bacteroidetes bacterium]|nr:putative metal-binding motif-containing protein [Bacteroidota bacterium]
MACSAPEGYADIIGDCYDANPAIYPGATEICNGLMIIVRISRRRFAHHILCR